MTITIIYDNETRRADLRPDWGFSCLIEAHGTRMLFDTGTDGALLLENMAQLGIDPGSIDELFLSHVHFDHIGGLSAFLSVNGHARIYAPSSLRGIRPAREVVYIDEARPLHPHFHTTGLLQGVEQSLIVEEEQGLVVVAGCSHPGVGAILNKAEEIGRPYALVGGLHGFDELDVLSQLQFVCPTHCTQKIAEIRTRYPDKYISGGAGAVLQI